MLSTFRDWLKTVFEADSYQIGKIDNRREHAIGISSGNPLMQVDAIGKCSSYSTTSVRILVHWSQNAAETETAARELYDALRHINDMDMGDIHVQYLYLLQAEPVFVGTDDNGIYEYVIAATIYYRR